MINIDATIRSSDFDGTFEAVRDMQNTENKT